ncbi:MAG TPA: hypothetical protein VFJ82_19330 [Longimicrobium sp.]|nr:hypothetical protein [Longimicrobium sp.]
MGYDSSWQTAIRERFSDRPLLEADAAVEQFWPGYPRECVDELFTLIETEFGIPIGLIRPEDLLSIVFEPVHSRNPLKWFHIQFNMMEARGEVELQLAERLRRRGTRAGNLRTFRELVEAWCG